MLLQPSHLAGDILPSLVVHSGYHLHKAKVIYDPEKPLYKKQTNKQNFKIKWTSVKICVVVGKKVSHKYEFCPDTECSSESITIWLVLFLSKQQQYVRK